MILKVFRKVFGFLQRDCSVLLGLEVGHLVQVFKFNWISIELFVMFGLEISNFWSQHIMTSEIAHT